MGAVIFENETTNICRLSMSLRFKYARMLYMPNSPKTNIQHKKALYHYCSSFFCFLFKLCNK